MNKTIAHCRNYCADYTKHWYFPILLLLTCVSTVVHFLPNTELTGADWSWRYGLNQAVALGMQFGRDIIWTYGPYSSINTYSYHPATAQMVLWGSLYIAISLTLLAYLIFRPCNFLVKLLLLFALNSYTSYNNEQILIYYATLFGVYVITAGPNSSWKHYIILIFTAAALGLLALVKATFMFFNSSIMLICLIVAVMRKEWLTSLIVSLTPIIAFIAFWLISGQYLSSLPQYLCNIMPIITGYQEAMGLFGFSTVTMLMILLYCATLSALILWATWSDKSSNNYLHKSSLTLLVILTIIIASKEGLIRMNLWHLAILISTLLLLCPLAIRLSKNTELNVSIYFIALMAILNELTLFTAPATLNLLYYLVLLMTILAISVYSRKTPASVRKLKIIDYSSLVLTLSLFSFIFYKVFINKDVTISSESFILMGLVLMTQFDMSQEKIALWLYSITFLIFTLCFETTYYNDNFAVNLIKLYSTTCKELYIRVTQPKYLTHSINHAFTKMQQDMQLPPLVGNTDLYSYHQGYLFAAGYHWNPRPIMQSYSAYTEALAQKNVAHLLSHTRPNNLIFNITPLDNRIPALEDGPSWPVILTNYYPVAQLKKNFLLLKSKAGHNVVHFQHIGRSSYQLGEKVAVPQVNNKRAVIFTQINIAPNLLGKILFLLYRTSNLTMKFYLPNNLTKEYSIVPSMAKAGFILSPLVENTDEFNKLYTQPLTHKRVIAFAITPNHWGFLWKKQYSVNFSTVIQQP